MVTHQNQYQRKRINNKAKKRKAINRIQPPNDLSARQTALYTELHRMLMSGTHGQLEHTVPALVEALATSIIQTPEATAVKEEKESWFWDLLKDAVIPIMNEVGGMIAEGLVALL
jgi:hypothetical protein